MQRNAVSYRSKLLSHVDKQRDINYLFIQYQVVSQVICIIQIHKYYIFIKPASLPYQSRRL